MNNHIYEYEFSFTQEQILKYAELTGDHNPVHVDPGYASKTIFKKPIAHGMLSAGIISKMLGMDFPGEGSIYLKQELEFLRPVYPETAYTAQVKLVSTNKEKHIGTLETTILDSQSRKKVVRGTATVLNKEKF